MQRELARPKLEVDRLRLVESADRLAPDEEIIRREGLVVAVIDPEMAARHDAHATILAVARREGDPGGHLLMRIATAIGAILVPGGEAPGAAVLRPERRGRQ